jgi:hypothetical protein
VAVGLLRRLAACAPVPVFPAISAGARDLVQDLQVLPEIDLVSTPRHATVLLVAGWIPSALARPLAQVHDQVPAPRATVWWMSEPAPHVRTLELPPITVTASDDVASAIMQAHRALLAGERRTEPTLLPHEPPAPWKGVGPYGQGGEGMMGGKPYGRPMPMTHPDRDGLELDQLSLTIGPFFPPFPPGLALDVALQGDVVQKAVPAVNPFVDGMQRQTGSIFTAALRTEVPLAEVELARARHHLRWVAHALRVQGLPALAARVVGLSQRLGRTSVPAVRRLRWLLSLNPLLRSALRGVGVIDRDRLDTIGSGPVARAAGLARDVRLDDPVYADLGFQAVTHHDGDCWARLLQRLAEAEQALELARIGERSMLRRDRVESPWGEQSASGSSAASLLALLPALLAGIEWGDAVTAVVSLDLDLEQAAASAPVEVG